jgi:hypothetical protein
MMDLPQLATTAAVQLKASNQAFVAACRPAGTPLSFAHVSDVDIG